MWFRFRRRIRRVIREDEEIVRKQIELEETNDRLRWSIADLEEELSNKRADVACMDLTLANKQREYDALSTTFEKM
jgi:hypothetical protein